MGPISFPETQATNYHSTLIPKATYFEKHADLCVFVIIIYYYYIIFRLGNLSPRTRMCVSRE
jgi:hypothetical protein